jgi:hypothetical protein
VAELAGRRAWRSSTGSPRGGAGRRSAERGHPELPHSDQQYRCRQPGAGAGLRRLTACLVRRSASGHRRHLCHADGDVPPLLPFRVGGAAVQARRALRPVRL